MGITYFLMGLAVYYSGLCPLENARAALNRSNAAVHQTSSSLLKVQIHAPWMLIIVLRNMLMTFITYSCWHAVLYGNQQTPKRIMGLGMHDDVTKFNPSFPPDQYWKRDKMMTMSGSFIASALECLFVYYHAAGFLPYYDSIGDCPIMTIILFFVVAFWSDIHFYFAHRILHPWFGWGSHHDPGKWLFKHVHSYHHVARNPGPWSGLAMHPVEHVIYLSRSLLMFVICCHPVHFLFSNIRAQLGPAPGHHGFDKPFGSRFHYIHHKQVECNYGTRGTIDLLMGTYRD